MCFTCIIAVSCFMFQHWIGPLSDRQTRLARSRSRPIASEIISPLSSSYFAKFPTSAIQLSPISSNHAPPPSIPHLHSPPPPPFLLLRPPLPPLSFLPPSPPPPTLTASRPPPSAPARKSSPHPQPAADTTNPPPSPSQPPLPLPAPPSSPPSTRTKHRLLQLRH